MRHIIAALGLLLALASPALAADISVTAANVSPGTGVTKQSGIALEAINAGQVVYRRADGKFGLCDNNSATAAVRAPFGVAVNSAAANQSVTIVTKGRVNIGATVAAGTPYFTSSNPGGIAPAADNTSGKYPSLVGFGVATTTIDVQVVSSGVAVP